MKRSRALTPLSSEHHQALLAAFQLKKGLAGHAESAGAPRDLAGLVALAQRFAGTVLEPHLRAEEEILRVHLQAPEAKRLSQEHAELRALVAATRRGDEAAQRATLAAFADLLERHIRWEERELFPDLEARASQAELEAIGAELERRLARAGQGKKADRS